MADDAAVLRYCREMTLLSCRPGIMDSRDVHKGLVVSVDGERKAFWLLAKVSGGERNGKEITAKCTVAFFSCFQWSVEKTKKAWSAIDDLVKDGAHQDSAGIHGDWRKRGVHQELENTVS